MGTNQAYTAMRLRSLAFAALGLHAIWAFVVASADATPRWEATVTRWFREWPDALAIVLWPPMQLGGRVTAAVITVLVGLWLGRRSALCVGACAVTAWVVARVMKEVVGRLRPTSGDLGIDPRNVAESPAWPSGHATMAFAMATVLFLVFRSHRRVGRFAWAAFPVALLTGVGRMYYGVHFPMDIVGGALLGTGIGLLVYDLLSTSTGSAPVAQP